MTRLATWIVAPVLAALLAGGCGSPSQVTYVDPNGPDAGVRAGSGGAPFERHGTAALERARACIAVRGALTAARSVASSDPSVASAAIDHALDDRLPVIEPRAAADDPAGAAQLRAALEALRDDPPQDAPRYNASVRRITDDLLSRACDSAVAITARQDQSFRAAMLTETLQDAAIAYEEAFDGGTQAVRLAAPYLRAYGLLVDASTRQLEAVPEDSRPAIRAKLDRITRRVTPGPTPPRDPHDPELAMGDLAALADEVALAARIDTTLPEPGPSTADQLRALKRGLAAAVEAAERGETERALRQLRALDRAALQPAANGIAAVSPSLLVQLEHDVLVALPAAIRGGDDATELASEVDARIDEATSLVEEELALLRDAT